MSSRVIFAAISLACGLLIGFGLVLQHTVGLEPCPMCTLQRYAFVMIGMVALIAAIHAPVQVGVRVYSFLIAAFAVAGGSRFGAAIVPAALSGAGTGQLHGNHRAY